jgi:hypothetical protein
VIFQTSVVGDDIMMYICCDITDKCPWRCRRRQSRDNKRRRPGTDNNSCYWTPRRNADA